MSHVCSVGIGKRAYRLPTCAGQQPVSYLRNFIEKPCFFSLRRSRNQAYSIAFQKVAMAMKHLVPLVFLVAITSGVVCLEYELAQWLGLGLVLIAVCGLAVIAVALSCAPLGRDTRNAFYVCWSPRCATQIPHHRFSRLIRARL